ncbi:MAG TPA: prolyl oligopeptidase family serine peptidase [Mycobacteriales bacterium]|nr:prolyl oligopeptidase family serine peptidase [Mycobacteriales bacterium]
MPTPPPTERDDVHDILHGIRVDDPYRWLEDPDSERTRAWVRAQNAVTEPYLRELPAAPFFREQLDLELSAPRAGIPYFRGGRYLLSRNDGTQDQDVVTVADELPTLAARGRVLIDPNQISPDGTASLRGAVPSPDGNWIAYGVSEAGSDWTQWKVRDVETGVDSGDVVDYVKFSQAEWLPDSSGFFYWTYPGHDRATGDDATALGAGQLMLHRLGAASDELVFAPDAPDLMVWPVVSEDGAWLVIGVQRGTERRNSVLVRRIGAGGRLGPARAVVAERTAGYLFAGSAGDTLYFRTDHQAPRGRVVSADLSDAESIEWTELIGEQDDVLERIEAAGAGFLAIYLHDCTSRVVRFDDAGKDLGEVQLGPAVSVQEISARAGRAEAFLGVATFTGRMGAYRLDLKTGDARRLDLVGDPAPVPGVRIERRHATSADGTSVPYFLLRPDGVDSGPALLYGYGGFDAPITPDYKPAWPAWLRAGGALAIANLRGGGEFGRGWHEAGMRERKQHVFDDFIAVGEDLVATGVTTSAQLAIHGRSNGGLLVGAVMTQRPDLAAVALPMVGVLDMLRYHRFTIGSAWIPEYGDPDVAADFAFIRAYSPLHNIRPGTAYPATLVLTGDHDDRVVPAHSHKFAATLQAAQAGPAPVLIRIETATGHGVGKPARMLAAEFADMLAFAAEHTGLRPA